MLLLSLTVFDLNRDLRHDNVVSFIAAVTEHPGKAYIITEFLSRGGLDGVLKKPGTFAIHFSLNFRE